jgi:hypothetical protein
LYIDKIHIYVDQQDRLVFEKKKGGWLSDFFFYVVSPVLLVGCFLSNARRIPTEPSFYIVALLMLTGLCAFMYFSMKLSALKHRTFLLRVENNTVYVNDEIFCKEVSLEAVVMREDGDGESSTTYHVGIVGEGKYVFCVLQQGLQDASAIAGIMSQFFQKPIKVEKSKTGLLSFEYLSLKK